MTVALFVALALLTLPLHSSHAVECLSNGLTVQCGTHTYPTDPTVPCLDSQELNGGELCSMGIVKQ